MFKYPMKMLNGLFFTDFLQDCVKYLKQGKALKPGAGFSNKVKSYWNSNIFLQDVTSSIIDLQVSLFSTKNDIFPFEFVLYQKPEYCKYLAVSGYIIFTYLLLIFI